MSKPLNDLCQRCGHTRLEHRWGVEECVVPSCGCALMRYWKDSEPASPEPPDSLEKWAEDSMAVVRIMADMGMPKAVALLARARALGVGK